MSLDIKDQKPLVRLENLKKIYGMGESEVRALAGINLDIYAGEFVAVMGASGSGKSTCLNMLGCLDVATSGHYYFGDLDVGSLNLDQLALLRRNYLGFELQPDYIEIANIRIKNTLK